MNRQQQAKRLRHLFWRLAARLPWPWGERLGGVVGWLERHLRPADAACIARGLQRALPGPVAPLLDRHFAMLCREGIDACRFARLDPAEIRRRVVCADEHLAVLQQARAGGRGVVLVMAHYGRLNLLLVRLAAEGIPIGILTMAIDTANPELDALDRAHLHRKVVSLQRLLGGPWFALGQSMRPLLRHLHAGGVLVVLLDAHPAAAADDALVYPFLDGRLRVGRGILRMAEAGRAQLVYGSVREHASTGLQARLAALPAPPAAALAAAVAELERDVREAPHEWWQWNVLDLIWTAGPMAGQENAG